MIGRSLCSACNKETRLFKPLRSWSNRSKTIFCNLSLRSLVSEMRQRKSKKSLRICQTSFRRWRPMKSSSRRDKWKFKMSTKDSTNSTSCWRTQSCRLRTSPRECRLKRLTSRRRCKYLRNQLWLCIQRPNKFVTISSTMLHNRRQLKSHLPTSLSKQSRHMDKYPKKRSRLRTSATRFPELELITSTVYNKTSFLRKNSRICWLSWRKRKLKLRNSNKTLKSDTTELTRSSSRWTNLTDSGLFSKTSELMRTLDHLRLKRIPSSSQRRS